MGDRKAGEQAPAPYDWWMKWEEDRFDGRKCWSLIAPSGKGAATVWPNGTWHTWDEDGNGGENAVESTVMEAMRQAMAAVLVAGHHTSNGGNRNPLLTQSFRTGPNRIAKAEPESMNKKPTKGREEEGDYIEIRAIEGTMPPLPDPPDTCEAIAACAVPPEMLGVKEVPATPQPGEEWEFWGSGSKPIRRVIGADGAYPKTMYRRRIDDPAAPTRHRDSDDG